MVLLIGTSFNGVATTHTEKGDEKVVTVERTDLAPFTEIEAGGIFNIIISQGETYKVIIEADENLLDKITTTVINNRLLIESSAIEKVTRLMITVVSPQYTAIIGSGASNFETNGIINSTNIYLDFSGASEANLNINSNKLTTNISGACDIKLAGNAGDFTATLSGASNLDAEKFLATKTTVDASGAASATVFAYEKGDAVVSGVADVEFVKSSNAIYKMVKEGYVGKDKTTGVSVSSGDDSISVNIGDIEVDVHEKGTKVRVGGREIKVDEDGNVDIKKVKRTRFDGHWGGINMGINGFLTTDNKFGVPPEYDFMEPKYQRSYQFNLNLWEQNFNLINNKFGLITGIGFQWNNYFFNNNVFLRGDSSVLYGYRERVDGRSYEKSKLVVSYLSVPLLMEYQTNKYSRSDSFHLTAGMIMGVHLKAHTKNVFNDSGKSKVKGREDYNIAPFRWDAHAGIGWGKINLFASYSLNSMFLNEKGPELYPFTVGITLLGW